MAETATDVSVSSAGGGMFEGPPCTGGEPSCHVPFNSEQLFHFNSQCESGGPWCSHEPDGTILLGSGNLEIEAAPETGWWTSADFAPLLYKRVDGGPFVMVARVAVSNPHFMAPRGSTDDYSVGGLLLWEGEGTPVQGEETFFKFEYGFLGPTMLGDIADFGLLWAQVEGSTGAHLDTEITPGTLVANVGLAVCRDISDNLDFWADFGNGWVYQANNESGTSPVSITSRTVSVGVFAGTFNMDGVPTTATFPYIGFRSGSTMMGGTCGEEATALDMALADPP